MKLIKKIVSGNEAIAIGAYKGNAKFASGYPGTPSSEILDYFKEYDGVQAQWASNEKAGYEAALGASFAGVRSFATMKHVGLNVAADPLMTSAYTGINAGCVIVCADDPGMHSSQNEQDNRYYAKFAKIPLIEPSDSFEAIGFMQYAFIVSERFDLPVLFRSTTRISHSLGIVQYDPRTLDNEKELKLDKNFRKYVMIPSNAIIKHKDLLEKLDKLKQFSNETPINIIEPGKSNVGIITNGISYNYAKEIMPDAHFFKVGFSYPMPIEKIKNFAKELDRVIVIEELEPYMEEELKVAGLKVEGKKYFPQEGEFNLDIVEEGLHKAGFIKKDKSSVVFEDIELPKRPPALCPGCPHRPIFDILHSHRNVYITGDIGCYTLGSLPPLSAMHTTICMGASLSVGIGASKVEKNEKVVSVIGDSTFFHTGIQSLVDAYVNKADMTMIILDNRVTAMTGGQPDPSSGTNLFNETFTPVNIAKLAKAIGIERVFEVDQYDYEATKKVLDREIETPGLSVIVALRPCVLMPKKIKDTPLVVTDKCIGCKRCLRIACPSIDFKNNAAIIDESTCTGCEVCLKVCPVEGAIVIKEGKQI